MLAFDVASQFALASSRTFAQHPAAVRTRSVRSAMKAKIIITPKKAVLDPQGKTIQNALAYLGHQSVAGVHVGKYVEIDLVPGTDLAVARKALDDACYKFLSNPIIEDYHLEIVP